jgi:regulator of protease activity HflC (stomatin/prohibitin superfamily)
MEGPFILIIAAILGGSALSGSVKIINQGDEALVETLGKYNGKKLQPGLNIITPFLDNIVYKATVREQVLDIPKQPCITCDNVSISVDAVVYWRIMDMAKAYYKVADLRQAMQNLVLTQIRAEMGKLELDQTFTARTEVNESLLHELDVSTDPWGVKVTRVELRDIIPSKAVQDSMELQMSAERHKRAAILTAEGEREAAISEAEGKARAQVLDAEARQKSAILTAEAEKQVILLRSEAERQERLLKSKAAAESMQILAKTLEANPKAAEALQFVLAQQYLEMAKVIGASGSSKVMFMDPSNIPATMEGIKGIIGDSSTTIATPTTPTTPTNRHS